MNDQQGHQGPGWTVVLRRRPARIVEGRPVGGCTDEFEIICCDCGDDPGLDYPEVSPALQRIRGPYLIAAGITAYVEHARRHPTPRGIDMPGRRPVRKAGGRSPAAGSGGSGLRKPGRGPTSSRIHHGEAIDRGLPLADR